MSTNSVEKNAQALNLLLRTQGKRKGRLWRQRIRTLLAQTFEALNAKPLDGSLCLRLSSEIEKELMQTEPADSAVSDKDMPQPDPSIDTASDATPQEISGNPSTVSSQAAAVMPEKQRDLIEDPMQTGLFDLIHIQIRCLIWIRACVRPPYIGQFVKFADRFAEVKTDRIEKFLGVLSKGEDDFAAKTEVDIGYRDDLLPDMPERGLVLHPKRKKK